MKTNICINKDSILEKTLTEENNIYIDEDSIFKKLLAEKNLISRVLLSPSKHSQLTNASCELSKERVDGVSELVGSGGAGTSSRDAIYSAIGEAIERFVAVEYSRNHNYYYGNALSLPKQSYTLDSLAYFSDEQYASTDFPFSRFTDRSLCKWYVGVDLITKAKSVIPGPFVAFPYIRKPSEPKYFYSATTGLAFGTSLDSTILSALFECLERDAFVLAWEWGIPARLFSSDDILLNQTRATLGLDSSLTVKAFDITTDLGIPCVVVFIYDKEPPGHSFFSTGCACRFTIEAALQKAMIEATQGISYVNLLLSSRSRLKKLPESAQEINNFEQSAVFYSINRDSLASVISERGEILRTQTIPQPREYYSNANELVDLLAYLSKKGMNLHYLDMSPQWLNDMGGYVVRVFTPDLLPVEGCYAYRALCSHRASVCANTFGTLPSPDMHPHPLP